MDSVEFLAAFVNSILTEGIVIIVVCFALAEFIKRSKINWVKKINRGYIPIIVAVTGMILSFVPDIFPNDSVYMSILKGFICGVASTGVFEGLKNTKKTLQTKEAEKNEELKKLIKEEITEELTDEGLIKESKKESKDSGGK